MLDYKKEFKALYAPPKKPVMIDVPQIPFMMVNGKGNPNATDGEYQHAVELLYGLSYTIKMSIKNGNEPRDYFEYVVPPLEGLWWMDEGQFADYTQKDRFKWISMIRVPDFVTADVFAWACREVARKKPHLDVTKAKLDFYTEGLCVQMMHVGPFDDEPATIQKIDDFIKEQGLQNDIATILPDGKVRHHHEIYLSDPRRAKPEKMKTIIRIPVKKI